MSKIARSQRKVRQARLLLVSVREETPELRDQLDDAIAGAVRAEDRSAEIIREATGLQRQR